MESAAYQGQSLNQQVRDQILAAIEPAVFGSSWEALDIVHAFEKGFGDLMGYPYVNAVQSGSSALLLALKAAGVGAGDEVITVANSDMATTNAIGNCGAVCVLCDVNASDYTMNVDLVESLITERTRAILPVDLYGHPVDGRRLREIADRYINDCRGCCPGNGCKGLWKTGWCICSAGCIQHCADQTDWLGWQWRYGGDLG